MAYIVNEPNCFCNRPCSPEEPSHVICLAALADPEPLQLTGSSLSMYDHISTEEGRQILPALSKYFLGRIHSVGQVFASKAQLQDDLTNFAIAKGFNWKYKKNDSDRLTVRCVGQDHKQEDCPWRLHASTVRGSSEFAIKTMCNTHTCGCEMIGSGHPRTSKKWVGNVVKGKLIDTPAYRAADMRRDIEREYGVALRYHQVNTAVTITNSLIHCNNVILML